MSNDLLEQIKALGGVVTEFKATNDARILEIEKKGSADPLLVEKQMRIETRLDELESMKSKLERLEVLASRPTGNTDPASFTPAQIKHTEAFEAWMRDPQNDEAKSARDLSAMEAKAVSSASGSAGETIPTIIGSRIQATLQAMSPFRNVVDVIQVGSSDYKELVDVNGEGGGWVGEATTRADTTTGVLKAATPTFGEVYAKPEIYEHILDDSYFDVGAWLVRKVSQKLALLEGEAFISGNGTNKPTGFLNGTPVVTSDATRAFQVLQFVATGAAANFQADGGVGDPADVFFNTVHSMKKGWRNGAVWLMNSSTKGAIRRLKNVDGDYMLRAGLEAGEGNELVGYSIEEMDHMPDLGANAFPVAFGNFKEGYLAAERTSLRITIDNNITTPGSIKYYVRRRLGGVVRQDQAIKLIKCVV